MLLEFGMLSRLLQDPVYEGVARRAVKALWDLRSKNTGLLGICYSNLIALYIDCFFFYFTEY